MLNKINEPTPLQLFLRIVVMSSCIVQIEESVRLFGFIKLAKNIYAFEQMNKTLHRHQMVQFALFGIVANKL